MLDKLKDKYVFFDVDGTLSEYRYNDILYGGRDYELGCQSLENLLFDNLFYTARPLKTMQNIIKNLDSNKMFILGAAATNNEINQKYKWLEKKLSKYKKGTYYIYMLYNVKTRSNISVFKKVKYRLK